MVVTVLRVGLTGGIGSGKSAVARLLAEHGAVVVDADAIAREVVQPGTPGLAAVVAEFGGEVLTPDGALDRSRLGAIVFADPAARRRLNAIVHPLVGERSAQLSATAAADAVVVHDVPLLAENGLADGFDLVLVVESPESKRIARLRRERAMSEDEVRARMAAQASDAERRAIADVVIRNDSTLDDLADRVDAVWRERIAPLAAARAG
jgi:dephospho-CoA kinase